MVDTTYPCFAVFDVFLEAGHLTVTWREYRKVFKDSGYTPLRGITVSDIVKHYEQEGWRVTTRLEPTLTLIFSKP